MNINGYSIKNCNPLPIRGCFMGDIFHGNTRIAFISFGEGMAVITFVISSIEQYLRYFTRARVFDLIHLSLAHKEFTELCEMQQKIIAVLINTDEMVSAVCPRDADDGKIIGKIRELLSTAEPPLTMKEVHTFAAESDFNLSDKLWNRNTEQDKNAVGILMDGTTLCFL